MVDYFAVGNRLSNRLVAWLIDGRHRPGFYAQRGCRGRWKHCSGFLTAVIGAGVVGGASGYLYISSLLAGVAGAVVLLVIVNVIKR